MNGLLKTEGTIMIILISYMMQTIDFLQVTRV